MISVEKFNRGDFCATGTDITTYYITDDKTDDTIASYTIHRRDGKRTHTNTYIAEASPEKQTVALKKLIGIINNESIKDDTDD